MASTKGSASAGIRKAATETSPSTWEWMCCNMRGQSAMPHPQRIAVKLGRSLGMSALAWAEIIVERQYLHVPQQGTQDGLGNNAVLYRCCRMPRLSTQGGE